MPNGFSIHVGVNSVDTTVFPNLRPLAGAVRDAVALGKLAEERGFHVHSRLFDEDAKMSDVRSALRWAAGAAQPDDFVLFTISSHGSQVPDLDAKEPDGVDETWQVHNGQIIDDEVYGLIARFRPRVRVLLISDSCHSGSVFEAPPNFTALLARQIRETETLMARSIPPSVQQRYIDEHRSAIQQVQDAYHGIAREDISASVIAICACQDPQVALDSSLGGLFTLHLLDAFRAAEYPNYESFFSAIKARMAADPRTVNQVPKFTPVGSHSGGTFLNQPPLTI
jgi:hypothetical protein